MIEIKCKKNKITYNVYHIVKAFFPEQEIRQKVDEKQGPLVTLELPGGSCFSLAPCQAGEEGEAIQENGGTPEEEAQAEKREVTRKVYRFLERETGKSLAWGTLTGVRPVKLVMGMMEKAMSPEDISAFLQREYFVSEQKAKLACEIAGREKEMFKKKGLFLRKSSFSRWDSQKGFSLYASIPFCPSVCSYCSFSSSPIDIWREKADLYLDALIKEIRAIGRGMKGEGPDTVYIGGGTPTTLEPEQLRRLLTAVADSFNLEHTEEFTVEAGRPDSITKEKLLVLKAFPVTRISINPQTMQQKTLDLVGRKHSPQDTEQAFSLARELGFHNVNMDLIAGLPGETAEDMQDTLTRIERMHPDSLTVHALAIKRAARMGQEGYRAKLHSEISRMVDDAAACAKRMGLHPYYLYRQKNIAGNFENVGYAELDKAGIYNILIMEEKQTIVAAGAGASTKILLRNPVRTDQGKEASLVHVENVKNIMDYIQRIDEMIERKGEWLWG